MSRTRANAEQRTRNAELAPHWTDAYIGIPFLPDGRDRSGIDCWGLHRLIFLEQRGIELPSYSGIFIDQRTCTLKAVAAMMEAEKDRWISAESPAPFDIVLLRTGRYLWHIGTVIEPPRMIHVMDGMDSVMEKYTGPAWRHRVEGFRRWQS